MHFLKTNSVIIYYVKKTSKCKFFVKRIGEVPKLKLITLIVQFFPVVYFL